MSPEIMRCTACGAYTLRDTCSCGSTSIPVAPPKYSPDDRHARLTRQAKEESRKERGLL